MVNLESVCDKVEKDNELGIWDENQDYGKILYFSSSRILVKKMGKRWSHRKRVGGVGFDQHRTLSPLR